MELLKIETRNLRGMLGLVNRVHTMPIQAFEVAANESNEPHKAKLELNLII